MTFPVKTDKPAGLSPEPSREPPQKWLACAAAATAILIWIAPLLGEPIGYSWMILNAVCTVGAILCVGSLFPEVKRDPDDTKKDTP